MIDVLLVLSCLTLGAWVYLAVDHGWFWRLLIDKAGAPSLRAPETWPSVTIVIPARNEADALPHSLPSLLAQDYPGAWRIHLVDDASTDGTGALAQSLAADAGVAGRLTVINAPPLPEGWTGKVAAMQAGVADVTTDYVLFTDADIAHAPDSLRHLVLRSEADKLDLNSLMVKLNCVSAAEKLLIPAFVFFFGLLYPFAQVNNPRHRVAGAAGGVMLVRKQALDNIGGLQRIKNALIDDCSLAAAIKHDGGANHTGGRLRLALTNSVHSLRPYPHFRDVWAMVARTAFTQLRHSWLQLAGTVLGMGLIFLLPFVALTDSSFWVVLAGMASWLLMSALYRPMTRFYGLGPVWALTLPLAALIYLGATLDSARRTALGRGGLWKNRTQALSQ